MRAVNVDCIIALTGGFGSNAISGHGEILAIVHINTLEIRIGKNIAGNGNPFYLRQSHKTGPRRIHGNITAVEIAILNGEVIAVGILHIASVGHPYQRCFRTAGHIRTDNAVLNGTMAAGVPEKDCRIRFVGSFGFRYGHSKVAEVHI